MLIGFMDSIEKTADNNVKLKNVNISYYRYYDSTAQSEFLFNCIDYTSQKIIPAEGSYLPKFDIMKVWLDELIQMPEKRMFYLFVFSNKTMVRYRKKLGKRIPSIN